MLARRASLRAIINERPSTLRLATGEITVMVSPITDDNRGSGYGSAGAGSLQMVGVATDAPKLNTGDTVEVKMFGASSFISVTVGEIVGDDVSFQATLSNPASPTGRMLS